MERTAEQIAVDDALDKFIEEKHGKISDIFAKNGEIS